MGRTAKTVLPEAVRPAHNGERARRCAVSKNLSAAETSDGNDRRYPPLNTPVENDAMVDDDVIGGIGIPWRHKRTPCYNPHGCFPVGGCRFGEIDDAHQTNPVMRFRVREASIANPG